MTLRINEVKIDDLVRELTPESLDYFANLELSDEWKSYESTLEGKFVRLGDVILLGATIDFGPLDYRKMRSQLTHDMMTNHGLNGIGDEISARVLETAVDDQEYLRNHWPLVDAGKSAIHTDNEGDVIGLTLDNRSIDYGKATDTIRETTGALARELLGSSITVVVK